MSGYLYRLTILGLVSVDLWILLKARRFAKLIVKLFSSILQSVFVISLATGVLLACILARDKINEPVYTAEYNSHDRARPMKDGLLTMDSASEVVESSLQLEQKLEYLRNQAIILELSLRKMRSQYNDLSNIVHSISRDEELADFASEAAGGSVLDTPDTESYYEPWHQQTTIFGIPIWKANYFTPRKVIQPWTQAGECWAFKGSRGKIVIELAYPTLIDQVTLEHIPASLSLTGSINSAPKDFVLYGLIDETLITLGSFTYNINGPSSRTFKLKDDEAKLYPVKTILVEVKSNWGHADYTCIYRFKVHGKLSDEESHRLIEPSQSHGSKREK